MQDPDADADDPNEWRDFFQTYGRVRAVTIARSNGRLLDALTSLWRILARQAFLDDGEDRRDLEKHAELARDKVRSLVGRKPAATVYVTFEHEKDAQKALERLGSVSAREASKNKSRKLREKDLFRGTNVLRVKEAPEPVDVDWRSVGKASRWRNLSKILVFPCAPHRCHDAHRRLWARAPPYRPAGLHRWASCRFSERAVALSIPIVGVPPRSTAFCRRGDVLVSKLYVARVLNGIQVAHAQGAGPDWPRAPSEDLGGYQLVLSELAVRLVATIHGGGGLPVRPRAILDEAQHPAQRLVDKVAGSNLEKESPRRVRGRHRNIQIFKNRLRGGGRVPQVGRRRPRR